jgi:hypothetical protein
MKKILIKLVGGPEDGRIHEIEYTQKEVSMKDDALYVATELIDFDGFILFNHAEASHDRMVEA